MRGTVRKISLSRRVIIDLMRASADVPFVAVRRTLSIGRLAAARKSLRNRPAWAAIFAKAFAILAAEQPILRRVYLKWPWPHFYDFPQTLAMIVVAPDATPDGVLLFPVKAPDLTSLAEADAMIRSAKSQPIEATPFFRKTMMVTRLPQPLRRLAWAIGLNFGRQRGNYLGTLLVTSVAAFGGGEVEALGPQSFILSYDKVSDDGTIDVMIRWDHRIADAAFIGGELSRLEQILNNPLSDEILALVANERATAAPTLTRRIDPGLASGISREFTNTT
ncbi:MAG TPA: acyltransferase [Bradyrhizobium sp.]|jgi:hypothetical protein|uniref:acyltransferase n=1 Tax=Bradyrhizobium sp. TaxID=376 RepID=UPI002C84616F|nr:acyltransferase [Bradyrhizobium sp.]HTB03037.1 acyltransferase [Bradyrhizobium sp.]